MGLRELLVLDDANAVLREPPIPLSVYLHDVIFAHIQYDLVLFMFTESCGLLASYDQLGQASLYLICSTSSTMSTTTLLQFKDLKHILCIFSD
jgi:hypothetical protein